MLYAVLSDIHGNYAALRAVVRDAKRMAKQEGDELRFICLGDVVDYGPQPNKCMAWVHRNAEVTILGNHDEEAARPFHIQPWTVDEQYWPITLWTRWVLRASHREAIRRWRERREGAGELDQFTFFHGDLWNVAGYINTRQSAEQNLEKLQTPYGVFGHTHWQGGFWEEVTGVRGVVALPEGTDERVVEWPRGWGGIAVGEWRLLPGRDRVLLNPGSVGQPRRPSVLMGTEIRHDCRAAYMLLRLNSRGLVEFQFRRVAYKVEKTVALLRRKARWPALSLRKLERMSHEGESEGPVLPQEVWGNLDERLIRLVDEVLIPQLRCGRDKARGGWQIK